MLQELNFLFNHSVRVNSTILKSIIKNLKKIEIKVIGKRFLSFLLVIDVTPTAKLLTGKNCF